MGLRWEDVDLDKGIINVNHHVVYFNNSDAGKCQFKVFTPKTEAGIRIIPMIDIVKKAFLLEKMYQEEDGIRNENVIDEMSGFIFVNSNGGMMKYTILNSYILKIINECNKWEIRNAKLEGREPTIVQRFSVHICRHTFATRLCQVETNLKTIQSVLGHTDIRTTLGIYADASEKEKMNSFNHISDQLGAFIMSSSEEKEEQI